MIWLVITGLCFALFGACTWGAHPQIVSPPPADPVWGPYFRGIYYSAIVLFFGFGWLRSHGWL